MWEVFSEDVGRRPVRTEANRHNLFLRLRRGSAALSATGMPIEPRTAKLCKSASSISRNSEKRSTAFVVHLSLLADAVSGPCVHQGQFARAVLEGSRFAVWQLYRSANRRLPSRTSGLPYHCIFHRQQNTRRDVLGSRLLQNAGSCGGC